MTLQEMSIEFDTAYNNIMSNAAPGFNEYEKSIFLTQAQLELVKNWFSGHNTISMRYDSFTKRQTDFSSLMCLLTTSENLLDDAYIPHLMADVQKIVIVSSPERCLFPVNETVAIVDSIGISRVLQVIPIAFDEYQRLNMKPYSQPPKNGAWRMISSQGDDTPYMELAIGLNNTFSEYRMRYVKRPNPIILVDLSTIADGLTVDGVSTATECELNEETHPEIVQRAVELAKASFQGDLSSSVQLGARNE